MPAFARCLHLHYTRAALHSLPASTAACHVGTARLLSFALLNPYAASTAFRFHTHIVRRWEEDVAGFKEPLSTWTGGLLRRSVVAAHAFPLTRYLGAGANRRA